MKKKGLIHSILLRYMVSYAAIMAVLFIGVGIYMNNTYATAIRNNTVESNINKLSRIRLQHEENITTLRRMGSQIGLSYYIRPFRLLEEPMRAYHMRLQLVPYTSTNDYIDQLYLIFNEDDYLYSSSTSVGLDVFLDKLMRFEETPPEVMRQALRRQDNEMTIFPSQNVSSVSTGGAKTRMMAVVVPLSMGDRFNTGNVLFLIREGKYQQMLADEIADPRSTYIFYGDAVLAASRDLPVPDAAIQAEITANEGVLIRDLSVDGAQYLLIAERGSRFDMQYVTLIPQRALRTSMMREQLAFGLFLFALSIPCIFLTYYFARRHTKPIRELRLLFAPSTPATDDFAIIHQGIEDLNTQLDESLPMRRANFVKNFVKGRYTTREAAIRAAKHLDLQIDQPFFAVSLIGMPPQEGDGSEPSVEDILSLADPPLHGYGVELVALEQLLFVLFAETADALDTWAWRIQSQSMAAGADIAISLSNVHTDFAQAGIAYLEASTAYDNRFVMGSAHVLRFSDVSAAAKDIVPFTRSYLDGFRKALRSGDARALNDRIDELFHYLGSTELSLFAFRMIYNNVIGALLAEHFDRKKDAVDTLQYYDVFTLSSCRSIADLDDILRKLCHDILAKKTPEEMQSHPLIREIMAFMQENFTDPALSMSAIADTYGISAVRLSLDFKELTGMSPSEYLLLLRMEKAKALLSETSLSIKDVGLAVGYYDASGFIRRFKRYVSLTPSQYRHTMVSGPDAEPSSTSKQP